MVSFVVRELAGKEKILTKIGKGKKDSARSQKKKKDSRISPLMWPRGQEEGAVRYPGEAGSSQNGGNIPRDKKLVVYMTGC